MVARHTELITVLVDDEPWVPAELFGLPEGCEYRIFKEDQGDGQMAIMCRFPPGYLEPRHQHESEHWGIVVDGEMHVDGKILRRGDFHHAPANVPHGPFYYPKGCTVFGTTRGSEKGASILHVFRPEDAEIDPSEVEVREVRS
jgi:quercetin dioxygenase-like cupin family protein